MRTFLFIFLNLLVSVTDACQPLDQKYWADSPVRVKSNYDNAKFVVVASIVDIRTVMVPDRMDANFKIKVERTKFRVERVFKGELRPADEFTVDSGILSCSSPILQRLWKPFIPGRKAPKLGHGYPKRWIIYYTEIPLDPDSPMQPLPFEISVSPLSRPVAQAGYDLLVLEEFAGKH